MLGSARAEGESMSLYAESPPVESAAARNETLGAWVGWIAFAGVVMVMLGAFHAFQGLVALFRDEYYVVGSSGLVVTVDYTTWGWVHLIAGIVVAIAGICVFAGQVWARTVGVLLAICSAVVNIAFLSAYPLWSLLMIALDVIVIFALTVHGSEIRSRP
jgi:hypothetical protein